RQLAELAEPQLRVARRGLAPKLRPRTEPAEEDAEHGGLQLVQARVVANELKVHLVARAVETKHPHAVAELLVRDRDQTAVTEREEVLRRIEAERRRDSDTTDVRRAECLRRGLDHRHAEL